MRTTFIEEKSKEPLSPDRKTTGRRSNALPTSDYGRDNEGKQKNFNDSIPAALFTINKRGMILECNLAAAEMLGTVPQKLAMRSFTMFVSDDQRALCRNFLRETFAPGATQQVQLRLSPPDRSPLEVLLRGRSFVPNTGEPYGQLVAVELSTTRERATIEEAHRTKKIMASIQNIALLVTNNKGIITTWNPGAENLFGHGEKEIVGKSIDTLLIQKTPWPAFIEEAMAHVASERRWEQNVWCKRNDGKLFFATYSIFPVPGQQNGTEEFTNVVQDITDEFNAQKAIETSENRFRTLAEALPQLVWTALPNGYRDYINSQWTEYTGKQPDSLIGFRWLDCLHPDDRSATVRLWHDASALQQFQGEYRVLAKDGVYRWFKSRALPFVDDQGKIVKWFGACTDIDDQKHAQAMMKEAQDRLQHYATELEHEVAKRTHKLQEALFEMESFSYTVSHDLKAPIRSLRNFSELLLANFSESLDPEAQDYLKRIHGSSVRMGSLIVDLLEFSRISREEVQMQKVSLGQVVDEVLREHRPAHETANVQFSIIQPFGEVKANKATLYQAILNLIENSVKFVDPGKNPEIRIWNETNDQKVTLFIQDNGIGINPTYHERIFKVFERLEPSSYAGTGIGLAIAKKAIERMNGTVGLRSKPGEGSTFWIELNKA